MVSGACTQTTSNSCAGANAPITFSNLLSNSLANNYDKCLDTMREDLAILRLQARAMEAKAEELRRDASRLSGERARSAARLAEVNQRHAGILSELNATNAQRVVERGQLEALLAEEKRLREDIDRMNASGGATEAQAAAKAREQDRLRRSVRAVVGAS